MTPKRFARAVILVCAVSACATPSLPTLVPADKDAPRVRTALAAIEVAGTARRALRVVGKLEVDGPQGSGSVREVVLVERPARLRLESLSMLNQTLSLLVVDGQSFGFFDGETLERGEVSDGLLGERLGLDLAPGEAVDALLAAPRGIDVAPDAVFARAEDRVVWLGQRRVWLGPSGELIALEAVAADGSTRWRAEYSAWKAVPGGRYPFELALYFPLTELRAQLTAKRVEVNPALDPGLFRVPEAGGGQ